MTMRNEIRVSLKIILILCFIGSNYIKAQDTFYYYEGHKINLFEDKKSIVMLFNKNSTFKNRERTFSSDTSIVEMDVSDGTEDIYFARLSYANEINNILAKLQTYDITSSDLETFSFGYITSDGNRIWPTNEVLIKLNPEFTIESIQSILDNFNASFFEVDKYGIYSYKVVNASQAFQLSNKLWESGKVKFAEPDFSQEIHFEQNDPLYNEQYYLNNTGQIIDGVPGTVDIDIDADKAWDITIGVSSIRVAVIDDGVDLDPVHEDMGNVISGYTPGCLSGCDGRPRSNNKHGQAVAGIIAASHNNIGVRGIAPGVTIVPFRIFKNNDKPKTNKNIGKAINAAWDDFYCDVLNNSWGGGAASNYITDAINNAVSNGREGLGSIVVFAAGNCRGCCYNIPVVYPASLNSTIAVGGVNLNGNIVGYTAVGPEIDVVTPTGDCGASNIRTTDREGNNGYNNGNYTSIFGGTSAACPQVSGIAALLLSVNPSWTESEVRCRIRKSARDIGEQGFDNNTGFGLVNAYYTIATDNMNIEDEIIVGQDNFVASNIITIGPNCTFTKTSKVEIIAGNRIIATAGSSSNLGSHFHAYISNQGPCGFGPKMLVVSDNEDTNTIHYSPKEKPKPDSFNDIFKSSPNPFTHSTTITFSLKQPSRVNIYITNSYGQRVHEVFNNYTEAGNYELKLEGTDLKPGLYFCIMETETSREVIKIVKM
jgi:subtilisin family serine protease